MDIETCIKYLEFVNTECDRHLKDGNVSDDELISLIVEFERFQESVEKSELPEIVKSQVADIKLKYSAKGVERGSWFSAAYRTTFGSFLSRKQSKRKEALKAIKYDVSRLASHLKMNY